MRPFIQLFVNYLRVLKLLILFMEFYDRKHSLAARYEFLRNIEGSDEQESRDKAQVSDKLL